MLLSADPPESSGKPEVMLGACNSMIEHKEVFTLGGGYRHVNGDNDNFK